MKKVIYNYIYNEHTVEIVNFLNKKYQWDPIVFLGGSSHNSKISKFYKNSIFIESMDVRKTKFDYSIVKKKIPVDKEILDNLSNYEITYLQWLQDTNNFNFSINERKRYYHEILNYWNSVIIEHKPEIFISYTVPHLPSDYALYLLCKYHYKIPTLFCDINPYFNKDYFTIHGSLENLSEVYLKSYKKNKILNSDVKNYLYSLRNKPTTPKHVKNFANYSKEKIKKDSLFSKIFFLIKLFLKGNAFKECRVAFKKNKKPFKKAQLTNLEFFLFREKIMRDNKNLNKCYKKITSDINKNDKFIYFPGPYQPEISSNLIPGAYSDVFLVLDILVSVLPNDWKIYYKEHPNTFNIFDHGSLAKNEDYFAKLKSYKNVKIIPYETDTFELTDNSQAVATVGGTAGWEAVVRNKPALVFGNMWHVGCESIFKINNFNDAQKAVTKIINGYLPDPKDVEDYAQSIFENSFKNDLEFGAMQRFKSHKKYDDIFLVNHFQKVGQEFYKAYNNIYKT